MLRDYETTFLYILITEIFDYYQIITECPPHTTADELIHIYSDIAAANNTMVVRRVSKILHQQKNEIDQSREYQNVVYEYPTKRPNTSDHAIRKFHKTTSVNQKNKQQYAIDKYTKPNGYQSVISG